jgi:hypothetical protein
MKWIYLIKAETELGEETYKIGITKREPKQRLKELQTDCFKIEENFVMLQEENSWYQEKVMKRFDN